MEFFRQLKDRRLVKIVLAYVAGGWVLLQAVDQFAQNGILPAVAYEIAFIWYVCGLPGALIVGWYHGEKGKQRAPKSELALLLGVFALAVTVSGSSVNDEMQRRLRLRAAAESELDLRRVAVLYFRDLTPGAEGQHLADGLTESLIDELAASPLDVVSRNGVEPYRGAELPLDSVARALEVGTVVVGTIEQIPNEAVRVNLRLVDGQSGAEFGRTTFERPAGELMETRAELAKQASVLLRDWLGDEVRLRGTRRGTENVAAWALYHRGERARKDAEAAAAEGKSHDVDTALDRADQLLSQAELVDPEWVAPSVLRGRISYSRARTAHTNPDRLKWIDEGLKYVDRALAIEPNHPEALEVRGTLKYLHYLFGLVDDHHSEADLIAEAKEDLERSVTVQSTLASAHSILSHLYGRVGDLPAMILSGRRAYEEDAYLENADVVIWRIVTGSYNLEQFVETKRWCEEGTRRFPEDYRFVACQLMVMATPEVAPEPDRAWQLLTRLDSLAPPHQAEWEHIRGELFVGGVLARAGMPDSARSVWTRARGEVTAENDPDRWLYSLEAYLRTFVGDENESIDLLKRYAAINPGASFAHNWWWRPLRNHPRWRELEVLSGNGHH